MDPRLPDGGPGNNQLRPRPAKGVPRHPRGHHRRDPRGPGGGGHPGRRRPRARSLRSDRLPGGLGFEKPPPLWHPRPPDGAVVHRQAPLRQPWPADRRAEVVVSRPWQGAGRAPPGDLGAEDGRAGRQHAARPRRTGRVRRPHRRPPCPGRTCTRVRRALRRLRRDRGTFSHRPHARALRLTQRGGPEGLLFRPRRHRLAPLRRRRPSAVGRRARTRAHLARQTGAGDS